MNKTFGVRKLLFLLAMSLTVACDTQTARTETAVGRDISLPADPISRLNAALDMAFASMDPRGEVDQYLRQFSPDEGPLRTQQFAMRSVRNLNDADLASRYGLFAEMLLAADSITCGGVSLGTIDGSAWATMVGS